MKRTPCARPQRLGVGVRVRKNGSVTEATALHDICDDGAVDAERSNHHGSYPRAGLAILALALGGFAIGTTEFVTMGLLPQIARGLGISIPSAGHAVSAYALGVVVGAPLVTMLFA